MPLDLFKASEAQSTEHIAQSAQIPRRVAIPPGATPVTPELGHGPQPGLAGKEMAPPPLAQRQPWHPQAGVTFWPVEAGRVQPPMAPPPASPWFERGAPRSDPGQQIPAVVALPGRHAEPDAPAPAPQSAPPSQSPEQPVPPWPQQAMRVSPTDTAELEEHQVSGSPGGEERQRRPGVGRAQERAGSQAVEASGQPAAVLIPGADEVAPMPPALQRTTPKPVQGLRTLAAWLDSTPAAEALPVASAPPFPAHTPEETGRRVTDVPGHTTAGEPPSGSATAAGGGRKSRRVPPAPVAPTAAVVTPSTREAAIAPLVPPHAVPQAGQGCQGLAALQDAAPTAAVFSPAVPGTPLPVPTREDIPGHGQHSSVDSMQRTHSPLTPRPLHPPPPHALPAGDGERVPYPPGLLDAELPVESQRYEASLWSDGAAGQDPQGVLQAEDTAPPTPAQTTPQPVQGLQALAALLNAASTAPATPASQNQSLSHQRPAVSGQSTLPQDAQPSAARPLTAARVDAASVAWERPVTAGDTGRGQVGAGSDRATAAQSASPTTRGATPQPRGNSTHPRVEAWHSQRREPLSTPRPDHPRRGLQPLPGQARQRQTTAEDLFPADLSPGDEPQAAAPAADGAASADIPYPRGWEGHPPGQQPGHEPASSARALRTDGSSALAARIVHWTEDIDLDGILEALAREIQQEYRRFYGD
jgi:hypothetical protein